MNLSVVGSLLLILHVGPQKIIVSLPGRAQFSSGCASLKFRKTLDTSPAILHEKRAEKELSGLIRYSLERLLLLTRGMVIRVSKTGSLGTWSSFSV